MDHGRATLARLLQIDALIERVSAGVDVGIFSHEFLFQTPQAAGIITQRMRRACDDVRVIGYVRPQSALLTSTYLQWLFRAKMRVEDEQRRAADPAIITDYFEAVSASISAVS